MIETSFARVRMLRCIFGAAQVEPAVADAERLVDALLVELERQRRRAREDLELLGLHLDLAGRHRRVDGLGRAPDDRRRARGSRTRCAAACAVSAAAGAFSGLMTTWTTPLLVAEVDEDEPAVVAARRDPAGDRDRRGPRPRCAACCPAGRASCSWDERIWEVRRALPSCSAPPRRSLPLSAPAITTVARAGPAGLGHLALERAARVVGVAGEPAAAELGHRGQHARDRRAVERRRRRRAAAAATVDALASRSRARAARSRRRSRCPGSAARRSASTARRSGRRRRSSSSTFSSRADELEGRARVVVEAADERRDRACTARRTRRGSAAPRRSAPGRRRRATRRSSARPRAPRARPGSSRRTPAAGSSRACAARPRRARRRARRATRSAARRRPAGTRRRRSSSAAARTRVTPTRRERARCRAGSPRRRSPGPAEPIASTEHCQCSR